jgi:simple sugar transport system ATP-binding protein
VFISHKLGEVLEITNKITVMRAGSVVAERDNVAGGLSRAELARLMVGRDVSPPARHEQPAGSPLLALRTVSANGRPGLRDVSLTLRAGEIVGVAGVSGNGQRALADVIAGVLTPAAGSIEIGGEVLSGLTPLAAQVRGIGRVPEDRMAVGMIGALPLAESMVLPWVGGPPFSRYGILDRRAIRSYASDQIKRFDVRTSGPEARTATLSGGNLQKALLARELSRDPLILLAAQPTRGIDVGATEFIHAQVLALRARGGAVLLISEDLDEIFQLSDRIVVMYEGRIIGEMTAKEATVERIGLLMAGVEQAA